MNTPIAALFVGVLFSASLGTQIMAEEGPWVMWGIGTTRCSNYTEVLSSSDSESSTRLADSVFVWATGLFSGMNLISEEDAVRDLSDKSVSRVSLDARLLGRCFETPEAMLTEILVSIYLQLPKIQSND